MVEGGIRKPCSVGARAPDYPCCEDSASRADRTCSRHRAATAYCQPHATAASAAAANDSRSSSPISGSGRTSISQVPALVTARKVRRVLPAFPRRGEPQPQRLGHHVDQNPGKIQGQQHPGLLHALGPVMTARADQVLKARTMPLSPPPGKPANRAALLARHPGQIPHRAGDLVPVYPPRHQPAIRPAFLQVQPGRVRRRHRDQQVIPPRQVRPQRTRRTRPRLPLTLHMSHEIAHDLLPSVSHAE